MCVLHVIYIGCHVCKPLKLQVHLRVCLHLDVDGCIMVYARIWVDLHRCANIDPDQLFSSMASSSSSGPPPPLPKRLRVEPRGGQSQKARWAREEAAAADPKPESHLAAYLVDRWSRGHMSTPTVQQIAAAAAADGCDHADLVFLSKLGSSGKYPNNMYKELNNKFRPSLLRSPSMRSVCGRRSRANLRSN